ncbi:hypothetical protein [Neobacillus kokaensis]|uniref:hypothetical protein n=1 Tax=Neobacillus kokaensis TaxID=2759023 RepID=UPI00174CB446|nr:hypothetical protein [Neobacillus kokaensis]
MPLITKNDEIAINEVKQQLDTYIDFNELTSGILHRFIGKIEIKADGRPRMFYRFSSHLLYLINFINAQHSTWLGW